MAVIGRLDEQVDAVLIKPLARAQEQEKRDAAQHAGHAARSTTPVQTVAGPNGSENNRARREELPVWLL